MPANASSSSSSNFSLTLPPSSTSVSSFACFEFTVSSYILTAISASYIFFLPLAALIVHLGLQRWYKRRRSSSAVTTSNSDIFTYNIVAMELISLFGRGFYCSGIYTNQAQMKLLGVFVFSIITPGQTLFHSLTSVDRYLAVIHPILYLGFRKAGGVRNLSIVCVWVVSFGWVGIAALCSLNTVSISLTTLMISSFVLTSFCSLSVLRALLRPGPGEVGASRQRGDQLKRRAFNTITIITGTLLLKLGGELLCLLVDVAGGLSYSGRCVALMSGISSTVPSSYVLPLLFLHRARKLACFKYNTESGQGSE